MEEISNDTHGQNGWLFAVVGQAVVVFQWWGEARGGTREAVLGKISNNAHD